MLTDSPLKRSLTFLFQDRSAWVSYLVALAIAIPYILSLFPLASLAGHGAFFEVGDARQHVSSWWAFMADKWRFPLLETKLLNAPEGANIAFTDSIPLAALAFKPFRYWLPIGFHYFGIWRVVAYILQAVAAAFLIRAVGQRSLIATLIAVCLALMQPILLNRLGHTALLTQGYLILGLGFYFLGLRASNRFKSVTLCFTLLLSIALLTHPYLFAMVGALYMAFLGDYFIRFRHWKPCIIALASGVTIILAILAVCGYLKKSIGTSGYGIYSMNLLSLFTGGRLIPKSIDATGGQSDGFNYLGIGLIAALVITSILHWRWLLHLPRRYPALASIVCLLTIFALSNKVFLGSKELIHYDLFYPIQMICDIFRASGRMFWPVGYLLMLVGLFGVLMNRNHAMVVPSLLLVVGLQYYDTGLLRKKIHTVVTRHAIAHSEWEKLVQGVDGINLYPPTDFAESWLFFQGIAAKYGRFINTVCLAREQENHIDKQVIFNVPLVAKNLYIGPENNIPPSIVDAINHDWCRDSNKGIICVPGSDCQWWQEHGPTFPSIKKLDLLSLAPGLVIDMSQQGNGASLGFGFFGAEPWGKWTNGKLATLALDVPYQAWTSSWKMEVTAQALVVPGYPELTVEVRVNGEKITEWEFTDASQQKCVATIPGYLLKKAKYSLKETQQLALIEFSIFDPISSKALALDQDPRMRGLGLSKLTFSQL